MVDVTPQFLQLKEANLNASLVQGLAAVKFSKARKTDHTPVDHVGG